MMIPNEIEYDVGEMLREKVNEIFADFQGKLGIASGDINPLQQVSLDKKEQLLIEEIMCVLTSQLNNQGESTIHFITINSNGAQQDWHMTPTELCYEYINETCNLPVRDDTVLTCRYGGTQMYFETFGELSDVFIGEQRRLNND
jgi:hypothetical protein